MDSRSSRSANSGQSVSFSDWSAYHLKKGSHAAFHHFRTLIHYLDHLFRHKGNTVRLKMSNLELQSIIEKASHRARIQVNMKTSDISRKAMEKVRILMDREKMLNEQLKHARRLGHDDMHRLPREIGKLSWTIVSVIKQAEEEIKTGIPQQNPLANIEIFENAHSIDDVREQLRDVMMQLQPMKTELEDAAVKSRDGALAQLESVKMQADPSSFGRQGPEQPQPRDASAGSNASCSAASNEVPSCNGMTRAEKRRAYMRGALKFHPDKNAECPDLAKKKFQELQQNCAPPENPEETAIQ